MIDDPGIQIDLIGGWCPVQAEGKIDNLPFYFRARGNRWSLGIGGDNVVLYPDWFYEEPYGTEAFAAGWMDIDEAREFIRKGADMYRLEMEEFLSEKVAGEIGR